MIEECPKEFHIENILRIFLNNENAEVISKINDEYYYWDKVKYHTPKGIAQEDFWAAVKYLRKSNYKKYSFYTCELSLFETNKMQEILHNIDMNFGGVLVSYSIIPDKNKQYYLLR